MDQELLTQALRLRDLARDRANRAGDDQIERAFQRGVMSGITQVLYAGAMLAADDLSDLQAEGR